MSDCRDQRITVEDHREKVDEEEALCRQASGYEKH